MDIIDRRRSVRSYQNREVEPEKIEKLLRAAMQAPSAGNQKPWEFLVVRDPGTLKRLSSVSPYAGHVARAPLAVVLMGDTTHLRFPESWEQDLSASAENLLLEAVNQGLGAVWAGIHPFAEREAAVRELFSLPPELTPFAIIAVGYPEKTDANRLIDRYDPSRVHYETL